MKKFKKIVTLGLCCTAIAAMLTACGSKFTGEWKLTGASYGDTEFTSEQLEKLDFYIEFNKDGSGEMNVGDETQDFEWEDDGDTVEITPEDDDSIDAEINDDDELVIESEGVKFVFEKQD